MTIIIDKVDCPFVTLSGIRHLRWRVATTSWQVLSLRGLCHANAAIPLPSQFTKRERGRVQPEIEGVSQPATTRVEGGPRRLSVSPDRDPSLFSFRHQRRLAGRGDASQKSRITRRNYPSAAIRRNSTLYMIDSILQAETRQKQISNAPLT